MGNQKFTIGSGFRYMVDSDVGINNFVMQFVTRSIALVPGLKEWEFILEDIKGDETEPHYQIHIISSAGKGNSCALEKIQTLRNHPEIFNTGELRNQELLDGEVSWYGGITIPYSGQEFINNDYVEVNGLVRIAFSGANQAIDLGIAIDAFTAYRRVCDELSAVYVYDLASPARDQLVAYMLYLKEVGFLCE